MTEAIGVPQARFIDQRTGDVSREWRFFLIALWSRSGGSSVDVTTDVAPPFHDAFSTPAYEDVTPPSQSIFMASDDVAPPAAQSVAVVDDVSADPGRIEALEGAIKLLRDEIEALKRGTTP